MDCNSPEQLSLLEDGAPSEPESATPPLPQQPPPLAETRELAPMLQYHLDLKRQYPEHLLLFQVGDFYEIFFDDAPKAADTLSIRLTSRNKDEPDPIPMCGFPIHAIDNYLPRLLRAGHSCVVINQVEESKGRKGGMQREISRIVTPGIRYEGDGLDEKRFNYLASLLVSSRGDGAIGFVDVSTGWLRLQEFESVDDLADTLRRVGPVELIVPSLVDGTAVERTSKWFREITQLSTDMGIKLVYRPYEKIGRDALVQRFSALFTAKADWSAATLEKISLESLQVLHSLLNYVEEVSFGNPPKMSQFTKEESEQVVLIDAATRRNLEITETRIDGDRKNALLSHLDCTKTAMGSRMHGEWILSPSSKREEIEERLDAVQELLEKREIRSVFRDTLRGVRDIDRLVSRITGMRAMPKDLGMLRESVASFPSLLGQFGLFESKKLQSIASDFDALEDIAARLTDALEEELPVRLNEGGIFRLGFHAEVDRLRNIGDTGHSWLLELEKRERERTGISSLKVKFNNVFGYFLEITKAHLDKVPKEYERRQTLVNAERYVIPELKEYEASLLSAKARRIELEKELFLDLRRWVAEQAGRIQLSARVLSVMDVLCSFAHVTELHGYVRPILREDSVTKIIGGRHPVVEQVLGFHQFVPNDAFLDTEERRIAILTGPNMGGKSTYLRQVGLIQLLAQAGSFVPAQSAELGVVDRIFTRIGAADDLARGDSTFMVEMREAATILRKATSKSLVLIDEIGRGTATKDGFALASAIAEWLRDVIGCRTLFATHFHELTELAEKKRGVFCLSVGVIESGDELRFTHRIEERPASRSYGIEVARLAGLPERLILRARELLVEDASSTAHHKTTTTAKPAPVESTLRTELEKIVQRIERCEPDRLTPIQALLELQELKTFVKG